MTIEKELKLTYEAYKKEALLFMKPEDIMTFEEFKKACNIKDK